MTTTKRTMLWEEPGTKKKILLENGEEIKSRTVRKLVRTLGFVNSRDLRDLKQQCFAKQY